MLNSLIQTPDPATPNTYFRKLVEFAPERESDDTDSLRAEFSDDPRVFAFICAWDAAKAELCK